MLKETDLYRHQVKSKDHIIEHPFAGLLLDMSLGKTISTLMAVKYLMFEDFEINRPLIIAPKKETESVWTDEVKIWEQVNGLKLSRIIGTPKQREVALYRKADIYLVNIHNVVWLLDKFKNQELPFDMLILDESSCFKNPRSKRFKALRRVQPSFKRVVLLTGTPTPNGYEDLWSQMYLLDRGARLGRTLGVYRDRYFKPGQRNGHIVYNWNLREGAEDEINRKISDICISMKSEDYLDLPEVIYNNVKIELTPTLKAKYEEFEKEQVLEMYEGVEDITAVNSAVLSGKLCQFCNGAIYDEDKNWHEIHKLKLEELEAIIERANGRPVLVAREFQHDAVRIKEHLKDYDVRELKTPQDIQDWNDRKIEVLMMHPASGGHGLNLQRGGNIVVWFGQIWNLEYYKQLNKRLHRLGQECVVTIYHLMIEGSIEEDILRSRSNKDASQESLMKAVKARVDQYLKLHKDGK